MAQATWEKTANPELERLTKSGGRWKFMVGGLLILAAVAYLVVSSTLTGASYFITVGELLENPDYVGQTVRISGAVHGNTIAYDSSTLDLAFTISHIPEEFENLAEALHDSVNDPSMPQLAVFMEDEVKPDLLQHEAQAIITGQLRPDGTFFATELLLKCPSRFDDGSPDAGLADNHPDMNINAG